MKIPPAKDTIVTKSDLHGMSILTVRTESEMDDLYRSISEPLIEKAMKTTTQFYEAHQRREIDSKRCTEGVISAAISTASSMLGSILATNLANGMMTSENAERALRDAVDVIGNLTAQNVNSSADALHADEADETQPPN